MRLALSDLRRRALSLLKAGLDPYAERALRSWWGAAEAQEAWPGAAEAAMWAIGLALDQDRPADALALGAEALPKVASRGHIDGNVLARLYIFLAKAAWHIGNEAEMRAFTEAARDTVDRQPVEPLVRAHYGVVESLVALHADDLTGATAWALQALDVAEAIGDQRAMLLCRQNLSHLWTARGDFRRARDAVGDLIAPDTRDDLDLIDLLVNGVHIALGEGEVAEAGWLARRATQAYCRAPSQLGPTSAGFLFEALAHYQAACGGVRAAEVLGATAHGWFTLRLRRRDASRVARWLAELASRPATGDGEHATVDPDLLYLADMFAAARRSPGAASAWALARAVNGLLRDIDRTVHVAPCENAALLWRLSAAERWFTGRSPVGQAAELVLGGADAAGQSGVELLAGYQRLATGGASWAQSQRILRRGGADPRSLANLDRLYRQAIG